MASTSRSLWPENVITRTVLSPAVILRRQAEVISELTGGLLVGEVVSLASDSLTGLALDIVAPELNNYRKRIVGIHYQSSDKYYPVLFDEGSTTDLGTKPYANTQEEFEKKLKEYFASTEIVSAIQSMIARSNEVVEPDFLAEGQEGIEQVAG